MHATAHDPDQRDQHRPASPPRAEAPWVSAGGRTGTSPVSVAVTPPAPDGHEHPLATAHF